MQKKLVRSGILLLTCLSVFAACSSMGERDDARRGDDISAAEARGGSEAPSVVKLVQVSDIPLPRESDIDEANSLVIGGGDRWLGRLVLKVKTNAAETYNYYFNGMPRLGWTRISAVQSKVSTITFSKGDRIATLQIAGGMGGVVVTVVVSTRESEGN